MGQQIARVPHVKGARGLGLRHMQPHIVQVRRVNFQQQLAHALGIGRRRGQREAQPVHRAREPRRKPVRHGLELGRAARLAHAFNTFGPGRVGQHRQVGNGPLTGAMAGRGPHAQRQHTQANGPAQQGCARGHGGK